MKLKCRKRQHSHHTFIHMYVQGNCSYSRVVCHEFETSHAFNRIQRRTYLLTGTEHKINGKIRHFSSASSMWCHKGSYISDELGEMGWVQHLRQHLSSFSGCFRLDCSERWEKKTLVLKQGEK